MVPSGSSVCSSFLSRSEGSTLTVYLPAGSLAKEYVPSAFVVVVATTEPSSPSSFTVMPSKPGSELLRVSERSLS